MTTPAKKFSGPKTLNPGIKTKEKSGKDFVVEKGEIKRNKDLFQKVVQIDRVSRTVKGGRRIRFRVLVVVGDQNGKVGFGIGKTGEVSTAVAKAVEKAKRKMIKVAIVNETIPDEIKYKYGSAILILKPAKIGTSIIAGGSVRAVVTAAGIKNVISKIIGSANKANNVKASIEALEVLSKKYYGN